MAHILIELTAENVGRAYELFHLLHSDSSWGFRNVHIDIVNNTNLELNLTNCGDDTCSWQLPQGHTDMKPAQVLGPASKTNCMACASVGGMGNCKSSIDYTPKGSNVPICHIWFSNPSVGHNDKAVYSEKYWEDRGYRVYFSEKRGGEDWVFAVVITQLPLYQKVGQDLGVEKTILKGSPSAVTLGSQVHVFHHGRDFGDLWHKTFENGKWLADDKVPNVQMTESPSAVVYNDEIWVFFRGLETSQLWYCILRKDSDGTRKWTEGRPVPDFRISSSPSAAVWNNKICVAGGSEDRNGSIWYTSCDGGIWSDTRTDMAPNLCSETPALLVSAGKLYCYYQSQGSGQRLWQTHFDGNRWTDSFEHQGIFLNGSPNPFAVGEKIYLFHRGSSGKGLWCRVYDKGWQDDLRLLDLETSGTPSTTLLGDKMLCFHSGGNDSDKLYYVPVSL